MPFTKVSEKPDKDTGLYDLNNDTIHFNLCKASEFVGQKDSSGFMLLAQNRLKDHDEWDDVAVVAVKYAKP